MSMYRPIGRSLHRSRRVDHTDGVVPHSAPVHRHRSGYQAGVGGDLAEERFDFGAVARALHRWQGLDDVPPVAGGAEARVHHGDDAPVGGVADHRPHAWASIIDARGMSISANAFARAAPAAPTIRRSRNSGDGERVACGEMEGLPCPILPRRHRAGALGAICRGHVEACQRSWAGAAPWTAAVDGRGLLRWRLPACVVTPRRLVAGVLGHPSDGDGARHTRAPTASAGA